MRLIFTIATFACMLTSSMVAAEEPVPGVSLAFFLEKKSDLDPFADDDVAAPPTSSLEEVGSLALEDEHLALFFEGVAELDLPPKGMTHPLVGRPIYVEVRRGGKAVGKLIQLIEGFDGGFYLLQRHPETGKIEAHFPSHNRPHTKLMLNVVMGAIAKPPKRK